MGVVGLITPWNFSIAITASLPATSSPSTREAEKRINGPPSQPTMPAVPYVMPPPAEGVVTIWRPRRPRLRRRPSSPSSVSARRANRFPIISRGSGSWSPHWRAVPAVAHRSSRTGRRNHPDAGGHSAVVEVIQTVREKFSCRNCETITQPPAPFHLTPRGFAGPNVFGHDPVREVWPASTLEPAERALRPGGRRSEPVDTGRLGRRLYDGPKAALSVDRAPRPGRRARLDPLGGRPGGGHYGSKLNSLDDGLSGISGWATWS